MLNRIYRDSHQCRASRKAALTVCAIIVILLSSFNFNLRSARAQDFELQAAPGALDSSFGSAGKVTTDFFGNTDEANCVAIQADGKIIVVGGARSGGTETIDFALVRYNADGTLDTNFGTGGKVTTDFFQRADGANAMVLQPDGKIVIAGGASTSAQTSLFAIARYNTNGSLDAGFGSGGKVTLNASAAPFDYATAVAIQSDGKIVVAGQANAPPSSHPVLARLNPDGGLDTSFGGAGLTEGPALTAIITTLGMTIQANGKIVISGYAGPNFASLDFFLARFNTNGSLDTSFGSGGAVTTDFFGRLDSGRKVLVLPDGKLIVSGSTEITENNLDFALARYNPDGSLDASFGSGGKVTSAFPGGSAFILQTALQPDGRIVAAGGVASASRDFALAQYNSDGSLDADFGTNGQVTTDFSGFFDQAQAVAVQSDGKIVAAGASQKTPSDGTIDFAVARYVGAEPRLSLSLSQNDINASRGTKVKVGVVITRAAGLTGNVTISPPASPDGIRVVPPDPITTTEQSVRFKLKIKASAPAGQHELTFVGTDERGEAAQVTLRLTIN